MFINKRFGLYRITFNPPPIIQGPVLSFDTMEEVEKHMKEDKRLVGDAWIILKSEDGISNHKFIKCELIQR